MGLGGLLDPATQLGLPKDDNDFGRTLGTWGLHPGPYLVLPLLGPSDFRDGFALLVDQFAEPQTYIGNNRVHYAIVLPVEAVNTFSESLLPTYQLLDQQNAFDRYGFARNAYLQRRDFQIHGDNGGKVDQEELDLQKAAQEDGAPAPAPAPGPAPPPK